jgi:2-polyprenyl-6-hydroxyphenyl methylase/3-demethylubiquinone-9 3-methyltransferase
MPRYAQLVPTRDAPTAPHQRARYARYWGTEFWDRVNQSLASAGSVLDVGGGRRPTISPRERPANIHYAGLDASGSELALAPAGSYDETIAAEAEQLAPDLLGRFDLIVSWQTLEHIRDLPRAAGNFNSYLRPGGALVACLSGRNAAYAIANRLLPDGLAHRLVARLRGRALGTVFPARYDHCDQRGLEEAFSAWDDIEVIPLWRGADYFERLPGLLGLYLRYEDLAIERGWNGLATHYVIAARKAGGRS